MDQWHSSPLWLRESWATPATTFTSKLCSYRCASRTYSATKATHWVLAIQHLPIALQARDFHNEVCGRCPRLIVRFAASSCKGVVPYNGKSSSKKLLICSMN